MIDRLFVYLIYQLNRNELKQLCGMSYYKFVCIVSMTRLVSGPLHTC